MHLRLPHTGPRLVPVTTGERLLAGGFANAGLFPCVDCKRFRPLGAFYVRKAGPRAGKPTGAHCKEHMAPRNARAKAGRYNIDYGAMLAAQGGACALCGTKRPGGRGRFHIDHNHNCCSGKRSCGKCVRGLLCHHCNVGIGMLGDDPAQIRKAAEYVAAG